MRTIDSKDIWYFGMASVVLSFVVNNILAGIGLLFSAFICLIFYIIFARKEKRQELIKQFKENQDRKSRLLIELLSLVTLEDQEKNNKSFKKNKRR